MSIWFSFFIVLLIGGLGAMVGSLVGGISAGILGADDDGGVRRLLAGWIGGVIGYFAGYSFDLLVGADCMKESRGAFFGCMIGGGIGCSIDAFFSRAKPRIGPGSSGQAGSHM